MDKTRCGECDECIERELRFLSHVEHAHWMQSQGDVTRYLNLMNSWIDLLIERGLPL